MRAYKKELRTICMHGRCWLVAICEVFDTHNHSHGRYCSPHADRLVEVLNGNLSKCIHGQSINTECPGCERYFQPFLEEDDNAD